MGRTRTRIAAALLALIPLAATAAPATPPKPRLVVVIVVDQFGTNLFDEWRGRFKDGLKRLTNGIVYTEGYQSHAATETCPGHSTVMTGRRPNKTGIVGNTMHDPESGEDVYCVLDRSMVLAHDATAQPVGPAHLMTDTLADWLKAQFSQSRVVAISGKDRGAITLAGKHPDGVFWLYPGYGFTTSIAPGADSAMALEPVAALNAAEKSVWTTPPDWTYTHAECQILESTWTLDGQRWESKVPPASFSGSSEARQIANNVIASPIPDDLTLAAARSLIAQYRLGQGPATDLLAVSFSATDYVGHRYGTRGPEMCEQMHRLDRSIGVLLSDLDALSIPYVTMLTADHGGSDFTERVAADGYPQARRVDGHEVLTRVNDALRAQFHLSAAPLSGSVEGAYLTAAVPQGARAEVAAAAAALLTAQPEMAGAYTLDDVLAVQIPPETPPDEFTLKQRFAASAYRGRSPDILGALKPYTTGAPSAPGVTIAGHGSPWNYDRRVPILFWWEDAPRQDRFLPVETVDIAPTLAAMLGITPPADIDGRCLGLSGECGQ